MAKQKTFDQARQDIFAELQRRGWTLKTGLKTPHATSPSGNFRLWFKPQAVHFTEGAKHDAGDARTIMYDLDIRHEDPAAFLDWVQRNYRT